MPAGAPTVVVGVDGSANSRTALRFAADEARRRHAALRVVMAQRVPLEHLTTPTPPTDSEGMSLLALLMTTPLADATVAAAPPMQASRHDRRLPPLVADELGARPGIAVETETWNGRAARVLAERAATSALLVVGARGAGGFRGLLLGSVAEEVLHRATCPVAVVRRSWRDTATGRTASGGGPVVVGIDAPNTPSQAMRAVLRFGAEEAALRGVPLDLLVVREVTGDGAHAGEPDTSVPPDVAARIAQMVRETSGRSDLPVSVALKAGGPAKVLVETTGDAALLVIGAEHRGLGGSDAGTIHRQVVRHATCPVAVVRAGAGPASDVA